MLCYLLTALCMQIQFKAKIDFLLFRKEKMV
jgi:hypothetical protein